MSTNRITYRQLTIPESDAQRVAQLLGFNEEGRQWYVYRVPYLSVKSKDRFEERGMQVYLPTYKVERERGGEMVWEERPKILNYLFVLATFAEVKAMTKEENVCPVRTHRCEGEVLPAEKQWQTIPNYQMHALMLVVQGYEQEVEFCTPPDYELAKGDYVRVVSGPFKGVEGYMASHQRTGKSQVYVSVIGGVKMKTVGISDDCIKVIRVSRKSNRFHRSLEAFERLMTACFERRSQGLAITDEQRAELKYFLFRYGELEGLTYVNRAKMMVCRYVAYSLLSRRADAQECMHAYEKSMSTTKSSRRSARRSPSVQLYIERWLSLLESTEKMPTA